MDGLADAGKGRTEPADEAIREIARKHDLSLAE
jgi:hypothetical protein